jgi:hypothetical protein
MDARTYAQLGGTLIVLFALSVNLTQLVICRLEILVLPLRTGSAELAHLGAQAPCLRQRTPSRLTLAR